MKSPSQNGSMAFDTERERKAQQTSQNNLIQTTRNYAKKFSDQQRFAMAKQHVNNALRYKQPRFDIINTEIITFYHRVYTIQTSILWQTIMSALSFMYMYSIIFQNTSMNELYQIGSPVLYVLFIIDFVMQTYHESFDEISRKSRFSPIYIIKILVIVLLGVDEFLIGFDVDVNGRCLHPFRVLRVVLPIVYNRQILRSFQSLGSAYKDIIICFIFYAVIISVFAIITSQLITLPQDTQIDDYKNNYKDLSRMIFIMYILGTYDAYPDNELPAIRSNIFYYGIFILFIFLNMFIFSSIPGSLIFDKFRQTRSRLQLLDQTKMQTSLIVAFVTIGDDNYQMDIKKMVKFLLYFYENRVRFVDTVTNICLKLNPNDHSSIHINQFMQLGRILQQNFNLRPPLLSDYDIWIRFRYFLNKKFSLKEIVNSFLFKLITSILIVSAFSNALLYLSYGKNTNSYIDNIFANIFFVELLVKMVAIGPQNYFNQLFSGADFFIIVFGFFLQFFNSLTNQDSLLRMFRIFRASFLLDILINNKFWTLQISIYRNLHNLFLRMVAILPIIMKFTPLYLLTYYVLGVLGMQAFYEAYQIQSSPQYNMYDQFSNFRNFIDTQLYFMQILTQAGWSSVAFDVAYRAPQYYGLILIFFSTFHVIIVLVLATLIKGIFLSTFITVSIQYEDNKIEELLENDHQAKAKLKFAELQMLDNVISKLQFLKLDSVLKREVYEHRMNIQILQKLKKINKNKKLARKSMKEVGQQTLYRNFSYNRDILKEQQEVKCSINETQKYIVDILDKFTRQKFNNQKTSLLDNQDFQQRIQKISKNMKCHAQRGISMEIKQNDLLNGHLSSKLQTPYSFKTKQNKQTDSVSVHIFDMHILLGMQTTWREQKTLVIRGLIQRGVIKADIGNQLLHKRVGEKGFRLDEDCTIRKTYLRDTQPKLIQKFEAEYFGNIYGKAFKQINKVTIQPLIKLQSSLVYALKNICRYPNININQFFRILTKIQNIISNQLLKTGSLFKFVFQLNCDKNIWFTIRFDGRATPHLSFFKHGLWVHNKYQNQLQIYYAKDLFRFDNQCKQGQLLQRANLMKKLYETFETLALTLEGKERFFQSNPQYHVYDNYFTFINVQPIQRLIQRELEISKVMVVLLTKQNQRLPQEEIPFVVSEIPIQKFQAQNQFKLDETQNQTFKKLASLASLNDEQATARQGLPFSYVLNFLQEINDTLRLHSPNFINHVQNLLNSELHHLQN